MFLENSDNRIYEKNMFDQRINIPQMNEKNWMIIVAVVIVLIGSLIYNIISARNLKKKRQQFVESIQSSYTHMKSIEDTSKKIYEISNEINEMIREQKDTEEYIEKKKKEIEEIRQMIVTNDTILDCAVSDKRDLARKKQIAFTYNIPTGLPEIRMEDVDKIRLFANLLDNAIEAAECVCRRCRMQMGKIKDSYMYRY